MSADLSSGPVCPMPISQRKNIILGHGSGGALSHELVSSVFKKYLNNPLLDQNDDSAQFEMLNKNSRLAITTDSHIVTPLFFPGGDIGKLAVCGTVNDLAMNGAIPRYLTAGFILEEGLDISILERVLESMALAAKEADVVIAAGDTKVVEKGKADQIFINTSGIGEIPGSTGYISGNNAKPGDVVILSGSIGDHGIAVMASRNDLSVEIDVQSDVAPLNKMLQTILENKFEIHVMRDPTRGGLATSLNEIACQSRVSIHIYENNIPIKPAVNAACEMLGFDPLYVANEGKVIIICPEYHSEKIISLLRSHRYGTDAVVIGRVDSDHPGKVILHNIYGTSRLVTMLSGELLPRIC